MSHGHHSKVHALSSAGQRHSWVGEVAPGPGSDSEDNGSEGYEEEPPVQSDTESDTYEEEEPGSGWVEGLTSLKEGEGATALLDSNQQASARLKVLLAGL